MTRYEISTDDDMVYVSAAEDDYDEADMLKALKFIDKATADWPGTMTASIDAIREYALAAIAKATD